jgi:hypothetical protein
MLSMHLGLDMGRSAPPFQDLPTPGIPFRLAVTAQPGNAAGGATLSAVTVQVQDAYGNVCPGVWAIAVMLGANPAGAVIDAASTFIVTTSQGVATFSALTVQAATISGFSLNGLTLRFISGPLTVDSAAFNLTAASVGWTGVHLIDTGVATTNGTNFLNAYSGAASNTIIVMDSQTADVQTPQIKATTAGATGGVHVVGSGMGVTTVITRYNLGGTHMPWNVSPHAVIDNLTWQYGSSQSSGNQFGIGCGTIDAACPNAVFIRLQANAGPDCFYFRRTGSTPVTAIACQLNGPWDVCVYELSGTFTMFNCTHTVTGPNLNDAGVGHGMLLLSATVISYYPVISVTALGAGSPTDSDGVLVNSGTTLSLYGGTIFTDNGVNVTNDVKVGSGGTGSVFGTAYNHSQVSNAGTFNSCLALAITQQPTTTAHGSSISPSITVAFQDGSGSTQTSLGSGGSVQVFLKVITGSGGLSGTLTKATSSGVATFNDLAISAAGTYQLIFAALGMPNVVSSVFTVT